MAAPILMPKQGQSVETCVITEWVKSKGDKVEIGDVVFTYETDKASFECEAESSGVILDTFFDEGDEVPVLVNVGVIGEEGEGVDEFRPDGDSSAGSEDNSEIQTEKEVSVSQSDKDEVEVQVADSPQSGKVKISPRAKKMAEGKGILYTNLKGSGPYGRIIERDVEAAMAAGQKATPLAQKMAKEEGGLSAEAGSGLAGMIKSSDLKENKLYGKDYNLKPLSNMRKVIARAMHASLQNSAQLTHHMSADVRQLQDYRAEIKANIENGGPNITLNDMICYCVVKALKKYPDANSQYLADGIAVYDKVHLGLAVDTPRGLVVPVLRNADDLSIEGLSAQMKNIAKQCREGGIDPDLLASTAGTFTVSNLGAFGVESFTPILNVPQVGILGVNTIVPKPKDLGGGVFGFVPSIGLSLTYDHRALDGAPATLFLKEIKENIENFKSLI